MLERGVALGQEADIPLFYRLAAVYLALAYALAGRATDALPLLGQIEGNPVVRGEAYLLAGEVEEAHRLAQQAHANSRRRKMRGEEARPCGCSARLPCVVTRQTWRRLRRTTSRP